MTRAFFRQMMYFLAAITFFSISVAQTSPSTASPTASAASPGGAASAGGAGTYSIEAEIFAYKSLQTNSAAIANDVIPLLTATNRGPGGGVVIIPSASAILPAFQLWRSNMLIIENFTSQYRAGQYDTGCPAAQAAGGPPSFGAYATAATQGVGVIQSILALFSTSQTVTEFAGTIQDQGLMSAVSRKLRASKIQVLTPDIFAPWAIANIDGNDFPFVRRLATLIGIHGHLQDFYQCNALAVSAASQLQQAEMKREADYAKLTDPALTADKKQDVLTEIGSLKTQIDFLRPKIGITGDDQKSIQQAENKIRDAGEILANPSKSAPQKATALNEIRTYDAANSAVEEPLIITATRKAAKAQSLVNGIEAYLAGLTGGAVNFAPPAASSAAASPSAGGAAATGTNAASPTPAVSSTTSATPPIVTILQADGLARKMGFSVSDEGLSFNFDAWRILWVKSLESGGAIITKSSIFGSHPHFGGGAVSGYALFKLDGTLEPVSYMPQQ